MFTVLRAVSQSLDARGGRPIVMGVDDAQPLDPVSAVLVLRLASAGDTFVIATVRCRDPWGFTYEAGPTGFGLYRAAVAAGIEMQVLAPARRRAHPPIVSRPIARTPSRCAGSYLAGQLTPITVRSPEAEAATELYARTRSGAL